MNPVIKAGLGIAALLAAMLLMFLGDMTHPLFIVLVAVLFVAGVLLIAGWMLAEFSSGGKSADK